MKEVSDFMKNKNGIVIILLIVILMVQGFFIYKKSYSGYILNPHYNMEKVNIDYIVLTNNLLFMKEMIPNKEETVMSIFFNEDNIHYDICLQYYFNRRNFYPITMPKDHRCMSLANYSDEDYKNSIIKNQNDYVILVGKQSKILNVITEKDISLYQVTKEKELKLIADYDNTLYSLRTNQQKYHKNYFDLVMNYIQNYINNYSYLYGNAAYDYLYEYANDLLENNEVDLANVYYNKYLELPLINSNIVINKAKIYSYFKDYDNFLLMVNYCNTLDECDHETMNNLKEDLEMMQS